jgi:RNA polymerase sigma-70 factor (ECF subfamily)
VTTQPELPDVAALPARPALRLAPPPAEPDVDFDGFVRAYEARLRRLVMRRIGDLCEAEEITQETLLRAYQHRTSFASEDELMAWSTVVAQRLVIDRVRVRGRSVAVAEVPETARLGRDTADIVVARHEARAALESLEAIPTRQAAILWAREVEGLHYEEIAERFGISEPAVRSLLHRGRKALRKEFKDRTGMVPLAGLAPFAPWLLALKAAGKVRGAAKTVGRSSVSAAAALSLTALVVSGLGAFSGGWAGGTRDVRISTAAGGATHISQMLEPTAAVERIGAAALAPGAGGVSGTSAGTAGTYTPAIPGLPPVKRHCVGALCGRAQHVEYTDATIEVTLPDNPVLPGVGVTTDDVDCDTTGLPTTGPVRCTQHAPSQDPEDPASSPLPVPPVTEGAPR